MMRLLCLLVLCTLSAAQTATADECRVRRVSYPPDSPPVTLYDDATDQAYWASNGFPAVLNSDEHWSYFQQNEDMICATNSPSRPYCVTYADPYDTYLDLASVNQYHIKQICVECDSRCDCNADQYCVQQYYQQEAVPYFNEAGVLVYYGRDEVSEDHGVCRGIPSKEGNSCLNFYDAVEGVQYPTAMIEIFGEEKWCGTLDGWDGRCHAGKCKQCTPSPEFEQQTTGAQCTSESNLGSMRWCNNDGKWVSTQPAGIQGEFERGDLGVLVVIAFCAIVLLILTCVICCKNRGATSV